MSVLGPKPDGFYQTVFEEPLDAWTMIRRARRRAVEAGYEVTGAITLHKHRIDYRGHFPFKVIVATVPVIRDAAPVSRISLSVSA